MNTQAGPDQSSPLVRGLPVPALLADLLASGRWQHPGDDVVRDVLPWFQDPLDFLSSAEGMQRESQSLDVCADSERSSRIFHIGHGSVAGPLRLPWLDAELAFFIAVNRHPGDDVAIALDYRSDTGSPAVVASDAWTHQSDYLWKLVAPNFETFANMLGIALA